MQELEADVAAGVSAVKLMERYTAGVYGSMCRDHFIVSVRRATASYEEPVL